MVPGHPTVQRRYEWVILMTCRTLLVSVIPYLLAKLYDEKFPVGHVEKSPVELMGVILFPYPNCESSSHH